MNASYVSVHTTDDIAAAKRAADEQFFEAVEDGFQQAVVGAGLDDGDGNLNKELVVERVYEVLKNKRVVDIGPEHDDRYYPQTSSTKDELTVDIFTAGPTLAQSEENAVVKKVYEKCQGVVWDLAAPRQRGRVQQRLEADKLLLVRGKVFRNGNPISTGVYVSTQEEIVLREFIGPHLEKLRKLTEVIEEDYKMATERSGALEAPIRMAIEAAMAEATAKLPSAALGAAGEQKALDR